MDQHVKISLIRRQILHESILRYEKKISELEQEIRKISENQDSSIKNPVTSPVSF
jgi:hypothetical protein